MKKSFLCLLLCLGGCLSLFSENAKDLGVPTEIPPLRTEATECYFLDEFMPTPDSLVTGKTQGVHLRHYTYNKALLRVWGQKKVTLSFYSRDNHCWSLFERHFL
jgi:hypothetical protein